MPPWCANRHDKTATTRLKEAPPRQEIIGIVTSFDNTPRREFDEARIWMAKDWTPKDGAGFEARLQTFRTSLQNVLAYQACCYSHGGADQFVLINAWNEWAEGMAMEPSDVYGLRFLEAVKRAKDDLKTC
jgi:Glycosyltransferase WbsX